MENGEKSPLLPVQGATPTDCSAYHVAERRAFDAYTRFVDSEEFRSFLDVDEMFAGSLCTVGNMTAEGALLLVKLGAFLRGKYGHVGIFQTDGSLHVSVAASPFPRTFQSAIALTSSFLYPFHEQLRRVHLRGSNNTFFCLNEECLCSDAMNMWTLFDMDLGRYFALLRPTSAGDCEKPLPTLALRRWHMARSSSLTPCWDATFVDACRFRANGTIASRRKTSSSQQTKPRTSRSRFVNLQRSRKLHVVEANAILNELVDTLKRVTGWTSPKSTYIKVFSGHDVTFQPLLTVLGIRHQLQGVHYGSRLAVEVYERKSYPARSAKKLLIRVVYDGLDRTHEISFCHPLDEDLCPANRFEDSE
ncbi:Histidine phosphatase superfamily [Aphelenchoides avenae]|nr:Histidine phosphatase superfamily [Aphelenchus avenae]